MPFDGQNSLQAEFDIAIALVRKLGVPSTSTSVLKHLQAHEKLSKRWDLLMLAIRAGRMKLYSLKSGDPVDAKDVIAKSGWKDYFQE